MNFNNKNKVTIAKDAMGNTIRVSKKNAEYSHIRLTQERTEINQAGWMNTKAVSTLIHGKTEELKSSGIGRMKYLPGSIVTIESHTPFSSSNPDRDLKKAGETGIVCCAHGEPIYRKTVYDATGTREDEKIQHTNGDAIREANKESQGTLSDLTESMVSSEVDPNQVDLEDMIEDVKNESEVSDEEETVVATDEVEIVEEEEEEIVVEESVFSL